MLRMRRGQNMKLFIECRVFRCVLASLYEGLSVRRSVRPSVGPSVGRSVRQSVMRFFIAKMKVFLHVYHQDGPGTSQKCRIASLQEGRTVGPSVYLRTKLKN